MALCAVKDKNHTCRRCADGWYSRRHQTRDAQDAARAAYFESHPSKQSHKRSPGRAR